MIGRGATDAEIRSACAPYCTGGFDETDLDDFLDRGRAKWNVPDGASVERLARLTSLKYDQQRKAAAKELGIRVSVLDRMVGECRGRGQKEEVDDQIAEINAEYALVLAGNKAAVMKFEDNTRFRLLQVGAFRQWFANQLVMVGKDGRFAWRPLAGPHGAAAVRRYRIRAAGVRRPHRLLQSVSGVCRRAQGRRLLEVSGAPEGQRSAR